MLINCVECKVKISDKAVYCPHCGYPLQPEKIRKYKSRKKLPNGFGQISEIKNKNLRRPYRAMVSIGTKANGRPNPKILGYFETYNEAYEALIEHNRNPYDFKEDITMNELFERWFKEYKEEGLHVTTYNTMRRSWDFCSSIYTLPVKNIKIRHIRYCIDEGYVIEKGVVKYPSDQQKCRIKSMFNHLLDYAVNNELIATNPARAMTLPKNIRNGANNNVHHEAFSDSELVELWRTEFPLRDLMLIQIYTGFRPGELLELKPENINLEDGYIIGGMKTKAGKDRIVPIHPAIYPLLEKTKGFENITYQKLNKAYANFHGHKPHDGRKTFITLAKKYNVDEYAIKYIVGHSISDLTERVYTDRELDWLREEIAKIKVHAEVTKSVGTV